VNLTRRYILDAPKGVRGRNSDNTMIRERLGWEPSISLRAGLAETYRWVFDQVFGRALVSSANGRNARRATRPPISKPLTERAENNLAA
jgi:dTDP-D-glucose 4,6-dehydratase